MGRLIDADILKQELYQQWFMDILLTQKSSMDMFYALAQKIDAQPTAYNPELVAQQLEELTEEECTLHECGIRSERCKPCIAKKAIEIVKGGGIDD